MQPAGDGPGEEDGVDPLVTIEEDLREQRLGARKPMASEVTRKPRKMRPAHSPRGLPRRMLPAAASFVHLTEAADEPDREQVHHERHDVKSAAPTAKIVLYSIDPVGTSPWPVAAMNAVMV